jgi:hypothetical protein
LNSLDVKQRNGTKIQERNKKEIISKQSDRLIGVPESDDGLGVFLRDTTFPSELAIEKDSKLNRNVPELQGRQQLFAASRVRPIGQKECRN